MQTRIQIQPKGSESSFEAVVLNVKELYEFSHAAFAVCHRKAADFFKEWFVDFEQLHGDQHAFCACQSHRMRCFC